jgi:hypothetical protein
MAFSGGRLHKGRGVVVLGGSCAAEELTTQLLCHRVMLLELSSPTLAAVSLHGVLVALVVAAVPSLHHGWLLQGGVNIPSLLLFEHLMVS